MFVGYLPDLAKKFHKSEILAKVFGYLYDALEEGNEVYQRITNLKSGETFEVHFGEGVRAIEQAYQTKSPKEAFYESHKKMVDFQMVVSGREIFFVAPHSLCEVKVPYDNQKDLIEYHPSPYASSLLLFRGNLAVFEPNDVHAGGIAPDKIELVQKVVVKVPKDLVKLNF